MGGRTKRTQVALYLETTKIVALERLKAKTGLTGQDLLRRAIDRLLVEHGILADAETCQEMTQRRLPLALRDSDFTAVSQPQPGVPTPSLQQKLEHAKKWQAEQAEREAKRQTAEPRMERMLALDGKVIEPAHELRLAAVRSRPVAGGRTRVVRGTGR